MDSTAVDGATPPRARRSSGRRFGAIGILALLGFASIGIFLFISYTRGNTPPRSCRGSGVPAGATSTHPTPDAAIAAFASNPELPRWQRSAMSLPADRWLRRSGNLYENSIDGNRQVMLDIGETDNGWTVSGFWICSAADA